MHHAVVPTERQGQYADQYKGLALAISSSVFIGSSFIIKKKGLRIAGSHGVRAGAGGFAYLRQPIWWTGLLFMVVGELANFAAYAFAPAIIVTPLGALSVIVSAVLAHYLTKERLNTFGALGCALCIIGSLVIVLHAPVERPFDSVTEILALALRPPFLAYAVLAIASVIYLIWVVAPEHGKTNLSVYIGVCSIMGSFTVASCKALGIAVKLTLEGHNQLMHFETYCCALVVGVCVTTQMNYLNKALDIYNTAIVSPVYYVMFTTLTIIASMTMFQDPQTGRQVITELCGFLTIVSGTFLLHATKDLDMSANQMLPLGPKDAPECLSLEDSCEARSTLDQPVFLIPRKPQ